MLDLGADTKIRFSHVGCSGRVITIIITITIVTIITITIRLDRVLPPGPFCSQEKASFMHSHHSLLFGRCQFVVAVVIQVHTPQP